MNTDNSDVGEPAVASERSDGDKYRWIRGNRRHVAVREAIANSDREQDFDIRIEAAMATSHRGVDEPPAQPSQPRDRVESAAEPGRVQLTNVDFLAAGTLSGQSSPATRADGADEGRFDEATDAVHFRIPIAGTLVQARVDAAVLRSLYGHSGSPMALFRRHGQALAEAVRDRVSDGSTDLIVLRKSDLE